MKYKDRNQSFTRDIGVARHTPPPDTYTDRNHHHGNKQRDISDNNEDFSDDVTLNEEELASLEVVELAVFDSNNEEERGIEHDAILVHARGGTQDIERKRISENRNVPGTFYNQSTSSSCSKTTPSNYYTGKPVTRWSVGGEESGCHGDRRSCDRQQKGVLLSHSGRGQQSGRGKSTARRQGLVLMPV